MKQSANSIRPFIGAKDYEVSRRFYRELGFAENVIDDKMSFFSTGGLGFYLQNVFVQDWIDNSMVFLEVENADQYWKEMIVLDLPGKFERVKISTVREEAWGKEFFVHDPSSILWHFGQFF